MITEVCAMAKGRLHGQSGGRRLPSASSKVSPRPQLSLSRVTRSSAILTLAACLTLLAPLRVESDDATLRGGSQTAHITPGKEWQILRNSRTGLPELMFGSRSQPLANHPLEAGVRFLWENKEILGVDPSSLRVVRVVPFTDAYYVYYQQTHNGADVLGAELILSLSRTGEVFFIKSTYLPGVTAPDAPLLTAERAADAALAHLGAHGHRLVRSDLVIDPKDYPGPGVLAWRLVFSNPDAGRAPFSRVCLVDSITGKVLVCRHTRNPIEGTVRGKVFPATGDDNYQERPFAYRFVRVGQTEVVTDTDGKYRTDAEGLISAMLRGPYFDVVNLEVSRPIYASRQDASWVWEFDPRDPRADDVNVFWHLNYALRYFDRYFGIRVGTSVDGFKSPLDTQIKVYVRVSDDSPWTFYEYNAWYDPIQNSLAFGKGGLWSWYRSYARDSSVIYHEYTHAVVNQIAPIWEVAEPESGALNEAFADYFSASIREDPKVGQWVMGGVRLGNPRDLTEFRRYEKSGECRDGNEYDYCRLPEGKKLEDLHDQEKRKYDYGWIHDNSLIFSSALWEIRRAISRRATDAIVLRAIAKKPLSFADGVAYILLADDELYGDGDISNGTPHMKEILQAFTRRGLFSSLPTSVRLSEGLRILRSEPSFVGDKLTATFTIRNAGPTCVVLRALTVGGRDPDGQVADFCRSRELYCARRNQSVTLVSSIR
jgi:Zn-dependent metalloprotease